MPAGEYDLHSLAAAFAMDAVDDTERARFAAHLGDCEQCREDVREMRETTARLGAGVGVRPRPELRARALAAASRTSQLGPAVTRPRPTRAAPWLAKLAVAAAVVVVAGAGAAGFAANNAMQQLHHSQGQEHMIVTVLSAPDAVMLTAKVSTGGTATVVMSHQEHALVFTAHGLRRLPPAMGYELWLMGPHGDKPAGMLKPQDSDMAGPAVVTGLRTGDVIGLTVEPLSGASRPTSAPVVLIGPNKH
jgi:hypothetical protein